MFPEKYSSETISFADFSQIYQEFLENDLSSEFSLSSISSSTQPGVQAMINAIRTFDHQGTGFISQAELQFSNSCSITKSLILYSVVLTGLGDKLSDDEFSRLRPFMDITPSGQVSYERKLKCRL